MKRQLLAAVLWLMAPSLLCAQQSHVNLDWRPQKSVEGLVPYMAGLVSPEVSDDHRVSFRVKAPQAQAIALDGAVLLELQAKAPVPFVKGADGVFTLTVGPLRPEIYFYKLLIDGVSVADPNNTLTGFANQPAFSVLVVHADGPAYYDGRNVPHGAVTRHVYHSDVTQGERELYVYTPPGYDAKRQYPVLYLTGGSGELASTWDLFGRVGLIEDNLLAEGKALPMIIVLPNNQVIHRSSPDHGQRTHDVFERELVGVVMPFVEKNYSVRMDRHGRALAGLSMGGRHAQVVGLRHLELFASFGLLSSAESLDANPGVFDRSDLNTQIDYLFVGAGTFETFAGARHEVLHNELGKRGIVHEYYVGGTGAHDFVTWRHLLYARFLPGLWRTK